MASACTSFLPLLSTLEGTLFCTNHFVLTRRSGPNHGHYIAIIKSSGQWLVFDDENVEAIDERIIQNFFGSTQETMGGNECGYILFYQTAA